MRKTVQKKGAELRCKQPIKTRRFMKILSTTIETKMTDTQRKIYLDILRIIAIILVLSTHQGTYNYFLRSEGVLKVLYLLLSILCKCGPPLFFMISGALLLGKEETYFEIFKKRILRFAIVMIIAALWISRNNLNITNFLINLFGNLNWYLYAYLAFLIMLPFLRAMVMNMKEADFKLFIILSSLFYTITIFFNMFNLKNQLLGNVNLLSSSWASGCWHLIFPVYGYYLHNCIKQANEGGGWRDAKKLVLFQTNFLLLLHFSNIFNCNL